MRSAMALFDQEQRGHGEWEHWQDNENHVYAIEHNGNLYPVKQIVSLASGIARSDFTGGIVPHDANPHVERLGFKVITIRDPKRRNPDWSRDELILALDAYLRWKGNPPNKASQEIEALSNDLNRLAAALGMHRSGTFRNTNGVYMKLMNFRSLDPAFTDTGRKGLTSHGRGDVEVWHDFAGDIARCSQAADAIRAQLDSGIHIPETFEEDREIEAEEGRILTYAHLRRERNRSIVEKKKASVRKAKGCLKCEACEFDFAAHYPGRGEGFIECHHDKPVSTPYVLGRRRNLGS